MRILGVDPGTAFVGYGVIEMQRDTYHPIQYGRIQVKSKVSLAEKLKQIHEAIVNLIRETSPDAVAVEDVFVSCNAKTSLRLGHARGVILLAVAQQNLPVFEYAPREIKQAVVGQGNASKTQIQWMMGQLLRLNNIVLEEDTADGLAVALCHGLKTRSIQNKIKS